MRLTRIPLPDDDLAWRSLKTSAQIAPCTILLLFGAAGSSWAWGFLIGALLSLFSLFSLVALVPMLFSSNRPPRHIQRALRLLLLLKLPLYVLGLYLATHLPGIHLLGVVAGIALAPAVITLKTLGGLLQAWIRAPRLEQAGSFGATDSLSDLPQSLRPDRPAHAEFTPERG